MADDDEGPLERLRFGLPPITLPPLFPDDLRLVHPIAERVRGSGNLLLAAVVLDLIDAVAVLAVGGGVARVALGVLLAVVLVGSPGLVYAWEAVALLGVPWLGVAPSATALVLLARRR